MIFLIEYDRRSGRVVTFVAYDETSRALADNARLDLELRLNREGIEREVVLLEAATEEALRRTHGRYFEDLGGLRSNPPKDLVKHRRKVSEGPGRG